MDKLNNMYSLYKKLFSYICGKPVVFVCIGTDLVGGDCLGPLIGQMLIESGIPSYVYGTLEHPVNALNVDEVGEFIRQKHTDSVIVAIDSAVGTLPEKGQIFINRKPLYPGLANGKRLNAIGDIAVTAVTSTHSPKDKEFSLVRLGFVYAIAKKLSGLLINCLNHSLCFSPSNGITKAVI